MTERPLSPPPTVAALGLDARLYRWLTLFGTVVTIGLVIPSNLLLGMTLPVNLAVLGFGLASFLLHILARRGHRYPRLLGALLIVLVNAIWFGDAGVDGTATAWFTLTATLIMLFFQGRERWGVLAFFLANGVILLWLDYRFPGLAVRFPTRRERYTDIVLGFPLAEATCAVMFAIVLEAYRRERDRMADATRALEQSLAEIRTLRGCLPICAWCKNIRDDAGEWVQIEAFVADRTEAAFTHGICPTCEKAHE